MTTEDIQKAIGRIQSVHQHIGNVRSLISRKQVTRTKDDDDQDRTLGDWQEQLFLALGDLTELAESEGSIPRSAPPCRFFVTGEFPHRCAVCGSHEDSHANSTAVPALPGSPSPPHKHNDDAAS